jgi:hypothetical protein
MIPANIITKIREVLTYIATDVVIGWWVDLCSNCVPFGIYLECPLKLMYR